MTSDETAAFWASTAQIVPVFALTLVLELRRTASQWNLAMKAQRRIESVVLLTTGGALYWLFNDSLAGMRGRPAMEPRYAAALLGIVLFLLAVNPLWLGVVRGNADILVMAAKMLGPLFRVLNFRVRGELNSLEADISAEIEDLNASIPRIDGIIKNLRVIDGQILYPTDELSRHFQDLMEHIEKIVGENDDSLMRETWERYENEPSRERARQV